MSAEVIDLVTKLHEQIAEMRDCDTKSPQYALLLKRILMLESLEQRSWMMEAKGNE